jgi:hypothetical protein
LFSEGSDGRRRQHKRPFREPASPPCVFSHQRKSGRSKMASASNGNPQHHTQKMKKRLQETADHLRQDITKVDEPQLKAMFETSAEVLGGLIKAFGDYEKKNEAAWQK